jgi:hypothetical protein
MKLAIMQPYLLPYIGYFQLMKYVDKFIIYDDVNFINRGWINRNKILTNNKENIFTIPLISASQNKLINNIEILNDTKIFNKILKNVFESYKKAPYFSSVYPVVEEIFSYKKDNLAEFNFFSIDIIKKYLQISTILVKSSSVYMNSDFKAQNRILDICIQEKADHYINPIGGRELYSNILFEKNNIKLSFIQSNDIVYKQFKNNFIPNLSIVDILMFNSIDEVNVLLNKFQLVNNID